MMKKIFSIVSWFIFLLYFLLCIISIVCMKYAYQAPYSEQIFRFGINLSGVLLLVYPIIGGFIYTVISLIGIIKNKTVFPYLILPIPSVILWVTVMVTASAYV